MAREGTTTSNDFIYAGAVVVTEELGVRVKKGTKPKEPMWKRRLRAQVKGMRRCTGLHNGCNYHGTNPTSSEKISKKRSTMYYTENLRMGKGHSRGPGGCEIV